MKRLLTVALAFFLCASSAHADHLGIYNDAVNQSCVLTPGLGSTATLMHKFSNGATGIRFRVSFDGAPGSTFLSFNSPFVTAGSVTSDISIAYGGCQTGNFVIGTLVANFVEPGVIVAVPANGLPYIIYTACLTVERPATGGTAFIGGPPCAGFDAVQSSTWGRVKALYR